MKEFAFEDHVVVQSNAEEEDLPNPFEDDNGDGDGDGDGKLLL